jgi:hypothetical protein
MRAMHETESASRLRAGKLFIPLGIACAVASACGAAACGSRGRAEDPTTLMEPHVTFEDDVAFLKKHGDLDVLVGANGGRVAVSPTYQGRIMTSAVASGARSLGFVHRAFIEAGKTGTKFDNYGGEDRFWLGPEGGQFGLYFAPGKPFTFAEWQTPRAMQEGAWEVVRKTPTERAYAHRMKVTNWSGTAMTVDVARSVRLLEADEVSGHLGLTIPAHVSWVAFESANQISNAGTAPWTAATGLPSVWILGMFAPAKDAAIVIPFDPAGEGPIVNDRYFGKVPSDRLAVREREGFLVMKADGEYRSKIGLGPARARRVAGSYSAAEGLLTIVQYAEPSTPGAKAYVNSMWETQKDPYAGDVINAYNDGPTEPGKPSLGGFYELETSSPAAALAPGDSVVHVHRTFHFVGEKASLDAIATKVLGVSLAKVDEARR